MALGRHNVTERERARLPRAWKVLRRVLLPTGAIVGAMLTPSLFMPDPAELRRAGEMVDGTGYGSATILGVFVGLIVAYVLRSAADFILERNDEVANRDRAP